MISEAALAQFREFSQDRWVAWLQTFLSKKPTSPPLPVWEDRHAEELISLFRHLNDPGAALRFADALAQVFETTPAEPAFREWLYIELHALAVVVSANAKTVLRRRLYDEALEGLHFLGADLHALLLSINGIYEIDEWLADYIRSSAKRRASDLGYLIVGFRLLATKNTTYDCRVFFDRMLPLLNTEESDELMGDELIGLVLNQRWRALYMLFVESAEEPEGYDSPKTRKLASLIRDHVLPFFVDREAAPMDEFFMMLDFLIPLDPHVFNPGYLTAQQLFTTFNTVAGMGSMEDKETAIRGLQLGHHMTAAGWDIADHGDDAPAGRSIGGERGAVVIWVAYSDTFVKLDPIKHKEIERIFVRSMVSQPSGFGIKLPQDMPSPRAVRIV